MVSTVCGKGRATADKDGIVPPGERVHALLTGGDRSLCDIAKSELHIWGDAWPGIDFAETERCGVCDEAVTKLHRAAAAAVADSDLTVAEVFEPRDGVTPDA